MQMDIRQKICIQFLSIHRCVAVYIASSGSLQYKVSYSENPQIDVDSVWNSDISSISVFKTEGWFGSVF